MGILNRLTVRVKSAVQAMSVANSPGLVGNGWFSTESFAGAWQRDMVVSPCDNLLAISAVYRCISLISDDIGKLRLKLLKFDQGIWQEIMDPSPFWPVLRKPNRYQTRIQFMQQWVVMKLLYGNTYVYKERDNRGVVVALYILDSRKVKPVVTQDGDVYYACSSDSLTQMPNGEAAIHNSNIIHDRAMTPFHPLCGLPAIYSIARSGTQALKMQTNAAVFFQNMSRPSGQLTAPGVISDATIARMKEQFEQLFGGTNIGRLLVTGNGLKYEPMTMPFEQSQFIEQMAFTVEDIARGFGVPLYKLSAGTNPTFTNVGAMNQDYYSQTLQIYIEAIELLLDEGLALPVDRGIELDLSALLRMDQEALAKFVDAGIQRAFLTPNEGRAMFNLPPKEGGDELYLQQQNYSLQALAKRDQSADPFASAKPAAAPALPPPTPDAPQADPANNADKDGDGVLLLTETLFHLRQKCQAHPLLAGPE